MNVLDLDFASLTHASATYGYPVLFALIFVASAGAPMPVGILLAGLGAASAQRGGPDFGVLFASGLAASVVGDGLDFGIGRTGGRRVVRWAQARLQSSHLFGSAARYRGTPEEAHLGRAPARRLACGIWRRDGAFAAYGGETVPRLEAMIFLSRFALTALATPASLVAGATGMTAAAFLFWDAAGEAVFVVGNLTLGRYLSASGLSGGPLMFVLGALAVVSYVAIWLVGRWGHSGHREHRGERKEHERQAGSGRPNRPLRSPGSLAAPRPISLAAPRPNATRLRGPWGMPAMRAQVAAANGSAAASTQAPQVVASRRIVCAVRSATPSAMPGTVCGTG